MCAPEHGLDTTCFDSTYEGLKQFGGVATAGLPRGFDSTYEGLKHGRGYQDLSTSSRFDSTYEGLKPAYRLLEPWELEKFRQYL